MATLLDMYNQKSKLKKEELRAAIEYKVETYKMFEPYLRAKGYSKKFITWILTRM